MDGHKNQSENSNMHVIKHVNHESNVRTTQAAFPFSFCCVFMLRLLHPVGEEVRSEDLKAAVAD